MWRWVASREAMPAPPMPPRFGGILPRKGGGEKFKFAGDLLAVSWGSVGDFMGIRHVSFV